MYNQHFRFSGATFLAAVDSFIISFCQFVFHLHLSVFNKSFSFHLPLQMSYSLLTFSYRSTIVAQCNDNNYNFSTSFAQRTTNVSLCLPLSLSLSVTLPVELPNQIHLTTDRPNRPTPPYPLPFAFLPYTSTQQLPKPPHCLEWHQ